MSRLPIFSMLVMMAVSFGPWRYAIRSGLFHWRTGLSVALAVAVATAVLIGALIIGDSVRGSLRHLVTDQLRDIHWALVAEQFFREQLADEYQAACSAERKSCVVAPVIFLSSVTAESHKQGQATARTRGITLIGCRPDYWQLGPPEDRPATYPEKRELVINQELADRLQVAVGDELLVRLPQFDGAPADSALGKKTERVRGLGQLRIKQIVPARGLGRFSLLATQQTPPVAFIDLHELQHSLDQEGGVNGLLVADRSAETHGDGPKSPLTIWQQQMRPRLEDYGFQLQHVRRQFGADQQLAYEYYQLTTDRMLFSPAADRIIATHLPTLRGRPVFTYLANSLQRRETTPNTDSHPQAAAVPYSLVTGIDPAAAPQLDTDSGNSPSLGDEDVILNHWTAERLGASMGDIIEMTYFSPETTHGQTREESVGLRVTGIVRLVEPTEPYRTRRESQFSERPNQATDPHWTPTVPGITDQASIDAWDPPFPFDQRRIQDEDEEYWDHHRTTPKAFVSLATAQRLWKSRFGQTTSYRLTADGSTTFEQTQGRLEADLAPQRDALGLFLRNIRQEQLAMAAGTTPFDGLFLVFSGFLVIAAMLLVFLLFHLGVEQRSIEWATLMATGIPAKQGARLLMREGILLSIVGSLLGIPLGIVYARGLLWGLHTIWLQAITAPFLQWHMTARSLLLGSLSGTVLALMGIAYAAFRLQRLTPRQLLAGHKEILLTAPERTNLRIPWSACLAGLVAIGFAAGGYFARGEMRAGLFLGSGLSVLLGLMRIVWRQITHASPVRLSLSVLDLAVATLRRDATRAALTLGLTAAACFLIIAVSAFRAVPEAEGTGGFSLIAETDVPLVEDYRALDPPLQDIPIVGLRRRAGQDASCRNLYQPHQPPLLGISPEWIDYYDHGSPTHFRWSATAADDPQTESNPWHLLTRAAESSEIEPTLPPIIPVVIDQNTAMYALRLYRGVGQEFTLDYGDHGELRFRVVGLLAGSILQGQLMVSEQQLLHHFPETKGYSLLMIAAPPEKMELAAKILENRFAEQGLAARPSKQVLAELLAVQNTYLSTFQSLSGLGLLLGTAGLAAVQLRSVVQRRGELALLQSVGLRPARLRQLLMLESLVLLLGGLGLGTASALLALLPHISSGIELPWSALAGLLAAIVGAGIIAGWAAAQWALRGKLVPSLRGD